MKISPIIYVVLLLLCASASRAQLAFAPPVFPPDQASTDEIAIGDYDGDELNDIAYASGGMIYIHYNQGAGGYDETKIDVGLAPGEYYNIEAGDFNEDGKDDLVVIDQFNDSESRAVILVSSANGFIKSTETLPSALNFYRNIVVDFNGDDNLDFVLGTYESHFVVFSGDGEGNFTMATTSLAPVRRMAIADFNNDAQLDVVAASWDVVNICTRTGAMTFDKVETVLTGVPMEVTAADFSGDGFADIVMSVHGTDGIRRLEYWINDGTGAFGAAEFITTTSLPAIGLDHFDYDDDGRIDLVVGGHNQGSSMMILANTPTGFVDHSAINNLSNRILQLQFADLDGDDKPEIVELAGKTINIYERTTGDYEFVQRIIFGLTVNVGHIADMNGDHVPDLISGSYQGAIGTSLALNSELEYANPTFIDVGEMLNTVTGADFNDDGFEDLIYSADIGAAKPVFLLLSDESGVLQAPAAVPEADGYKVVAADFNGDGKVDFACESGIFLANGSGFTQNPFPIDIYAFEFVAADIDDDDDLDLVINNDADILISLNDGDGNFAVPTTLVGSEVIKKTRAVNYNNDNLDDLLSFTETEGIVLIHVNQGDGTFGEIVVSIPEDVGTYYGSDIAGADLDDDGDMEIIIGISTRYPDNSTLLGIGILTQGPTGVYTFNTKINLNPGNGPEASMPGEIEIADMDGDDLPDIIAFKQNGPSFAVIPNRAVKEPALQATAITVENITKVSATVKLTEGDGDGRLVVIRESVNAIASPADGTFYAPNTIFGTGAEIGTGNFVIMRSNYLGTDVTGLQEGTTYTVTAFEYKSLTEAEIINYVTTAPPSAQFTTLKTQTLEFLTIDDQTIGDEPITLAATSTSGLAVTYEAITTNITVSGNTLTLVGTGPATVKAMQTGDSEFATAIPVELTFCVKPPLPVVTLENLSGVIKLTSSADAGNQWLRNGLPVNGATTKTFEPTLDGIYSVRVTENTCSNTSTETANLVVGIRESTEALSIYPIPSDGAFIVNNPYEALEFKVIDANGAIMNDGTFHNGENELKLNATRGMYFLKLGNGSVMKLVIR